MTAANPLSRAHLRAILAASVIQSLRPNKDLEKRQATRDGSQADRERRQNGRLSERVIRVQAFRTVGGHPIELHLGPSRRQSGQTGENGESKDSELVAWFPSFRKSGKLAA